LSHSSVSFVMSQTTVFSRKKGNGDQKISVWTASAQRPPNIVLFAFVAAYLFAFWLGLSCFLNPFSVPGSQEHEQAMKNTQIAVWYLPAVYFPIQVRIVLIGSLASL
jgi:hypothetical protein